MKKKYNNESDLFADWDTAKLKSEAKSYDDLISKIKCYGTSDLRMFYGICAELENRGVEINSTISFN